MLAGDGSAKRQSSKDEYCAESGLHLRFESARSEAEKCIVRSEKTHDCQSGKARPKNQLRGFVRKDQCERKKREPEGLRKEYRFDPRCHAGSQKKCPEEIRVAFQVLAAIPDQPIAIDEILSVPERDKGVVLHESQEPGGYKASTNRDPRESGGVTVVPGGKRMLHVNLNTCKKTPVEGNGTE